MFTSFAAVVRRVVDVGARVERALVARERVDERRGEVVAPPEVAGAARALERRPRWSQTLASAAAGVKKRNVAMQDEVVRLAIGGMC